MDDINILWADDEIELLRPQILFLEQRGYKVDTVTNGHDALEECSERNTIDVLFLDESMPGMTGLETLAKIKAIRPNLPVVMITKNEAENIMEEAIGSQISDYLIKPVNPNQILLTLKKLIDNKRLVAEKTNSSYQREFQTIFSDINSGLDFDAWEQTYQRIINWEIKFDDANTGEMAEILAMQKREANSAFSKYFNNNYLEWLKEDTDGPVFSHDLLRKKLFPAINPDKPSVLLVLDNLRMDQWHAIKPLISELFRISNEDYFYSILPSATIYSRNALFAGLLPSDIEMHYPQWWVNENEKGGKNKFESELFGALSKRVLKDPLKHDYIKVTNTTHAKTMADKSIDFLTNDLTIIVYNFIDMLSHARTEVEVIKELAKDERAYRSLTKSWFQNSVLYETLQAMAERDIQLFITTDHGTIRVNTPVKVVGDRETTTSLRYKIGKNLSFNPKSTLAFKKPHDAGLPKFNLSSTFIFAKEDEFFLYPNNYNHYLKYYLDTFQHGGVSLEEIICPFVVAESR